MGDTVTLSSVGEILLYLVQTFTDTAEGHRIPRRASKIYIYFDNILSKDHLLNIDFQRGKTALNYQLHAAIKTEQLS